MAETLSELGEFGLIAKIEEVVKNEGVTDASVVLGLGDDTAAFRSRTGYDLLITCDALVEGRHYLPAHTTAREIGRRAMAVNISDIGAMGGLPRHALVSLGLKAETELSWVLELFRGFLLELNPFAAAVIGGNITKSDGSVFIDVTLVGEVESNKLVRRSTAEVGDRILVTGHPGQASAGLQLLLQCKDVGRETWGRPLVQAYNTPTHRAREGHAVALAGGATAMIDTSDGFLGDLGHICQDSRVGAHLFQRRLPLSDNLRRAARLLQRDPYELFLFESDDYELIITCRPAGVASVRQTVSAVSRVEVTEVGVISEAKEGMRLILPDGRQRQLAATGWNHFGR
jgi:thiamine-monophosphate kinase